MNNNVCKAGRQGAARDVVMLKHREAVRDLLWPTFSTTFMPCVAHTPPLMLSRPWRVPSDVAGGEQRKLHD